MKAIYYIYTTDNNLHIDSLIIHENNSRKLFVIREKLESSQMFFIHPWNFEIDSDILKLPNSHYLST